MPRTARLDIPNLLQHVIVRGVDRCDLFRDDADRRRFLKRFSKLLVETGTECLAWSLMTNHFHFLLRPRKTLLAPFMGRLLTGYALYFNLSHDRTGHLYQNRYKSLVCEEDVYLLELVRYIHLNPLRAGLVVDLAALDCYAWSGHSVIVGKSALEGQSAKEVLSLFSNGMREARKRYRLFIEDGIPQGKREDLGSRRRLTRELLDAMNGEPFDQRILGSGEFVRELKKRRELVEKLPRSLEIKEITARVCDHLRLDPEDLRLNTKASRITNARSIICYLAVRVIGYNGVEVGKQVNLRRAGVSVAADRGEKLVENDPFDKGFIGQINAVP
jgi:REP element-mobilizing transposase RayT